MRTTADYGSVIDTMCEYIIIIYLLTAIVETAVSPGNETLKSPHGKH